MILNFDYIQIQINECYKLFPAWKVSKFEVFFGPYFAVFSPNTGKYGPEETPYLDTFHLVVRTEKVDEKNGIICLVSMFPSQFMVLKLSKTVHFLQFWADLSAKPTTALAIYIYASESSRYTLWENAMVYRVRSHRSWDIND